MRAGLRSAPEVDREHRDCNPRHRSTYDHSQDAGSSSGQGRSWLDLTGIAAGYIEVLKLKLKYGLYTFDFRNNDSEQILTDPRSKLNKPWNKLRQLNESSTSSFKYNDWAPDPAIVNMHTRGGREQRDVKLRMRDARDALRVKTKFY